MGFMNRPLMASFLYEAGGILGKAGIGTVIEWELTGPLGGIIPNDGFAWERGNYNEILENAGGKIVTLPKSQAADNACLSMKHEHDPLRKVHCDPVTLMEFIKLVVKGRPQQHY